MSSPIKPPGKGPAKGPLEVPDAESRAPGKAPVESFREALARDDEARVGGAEVPTGLDAVSGDLRAGRIDAEKALEILVSRALESPAARALPPPARAELEAHLRRALAEDPSLAALTKDLER